MGRRTSRVKGARVIEKIVNLVKQLTEEEKTELREHIKRKYVVEEKEGMLRDDIKDKVIDLMLIEFVSVKEVKESSYFTDLKLEAMDIVAFADIVIKSFGLDNIPFSNVMAWQTVKDIINQVEDVLEEKPFISGFEVEP